MKVEKQTILILLVLFFITNVTCHKNPTAPKTGTLTGTVLLEAKTNHSGITVALYELAELDTTILRYNREYPNVGFPISQATEFACPPFFGRDHRLGEVVAEAKTKQGGWFKIESVQKGTYNIMSQKERLEWEYVYEVASG